jgi:hypothetical protein
LNPFLLFSIVNFVWAISLSICWAKSSSAGKIWSVDYRGLVIWGRKFEHGWKICLLVCLRGWAKFGGLGWGKSKIWDFGWQFWDFDW